jgi:RNA polymerase sigma-70 factor (ECF subfamily)
MASKAKEIAIDKMLVARFKGGDTSAFDEMVSRYWDRIFSRVLQLLKNRQDAEEVTQDAFMRAHKGLENFRGDASFSTWLFQIATNLAHNKYWYWFRRKRDASFSIDRKIGEDGDATFVDILPSDALDPSEVTITQELVDRVATCMPTLTAKHHEILTLRIKRNLSYEEISNELDISVGTVKSRIARARTSLRQKIGSEFS